MLIDASIILEILFEQEKRHECRDLLDAINLELFSEKIYITRFTLNALSAATRKQGQDFLREFLLMIHEGKIELIEQTISDALMANSIKKDLGLDFDDTTQYMATNKAQTYMVTFDKDFVDKGIAIKTPKQVLAEILG